MRLRLCGAGLAAALALVAGGCGGGDAKSGAAAAPISFEQLARSATTSADAKSGRFSFDMSLSAPGGDEPFDLSGEGAFDARSQRASLSLDLSSLAKLLGGFLAGVAGSSSADLPNLGDPAGWKLQVVQDGGATYVRFPALDDKLPAGKSWIRGDENGLSADGFDFGQFTNNDPRQVLDALRAVTGDVETVGAEKLRGVQTTHYQAVVDPARVARQAPGKDGQTAQSLLGQLTSESGLAEIPVDVWLDPEGLVRKLTLELSAVDPTTSHSGSATMSFELWDYGKTIAIDVPPASQVVAAAALHG
jgi:hypothetical protein